MHLSVPTNCGRPYDYNVNALYAKHDECAWCCLFSVPGRVPYLVILTPLLAASCRFLYLNLSPEPQPGLSPVRVRDCFLPAEQVKSFVVCRDAKLRCLDTPYHIFYSEQSYVRRQDPNMALAWLIDSVDSSGCRPWYGSVVVLKLASRICQSYVDMSIADVHTVCDFFAYFA